MTLRDVDIDVSILIPFVEMSPALWDRSSEIYKDRAKVKEIWWQITSQLDDQFESKTDAEQKQLVQEVKKKWINVRDSWIKAFKMHKRGKKTKKRKYIYFDQLMFLSKIVDVNQSGDDHCSNESEEEQEDRKKVLQKLCRPVLREPEREPVFQRVASRKSLDSTATKKLEDVDLRLSVAVDSEPKVEDPRLLFFKGILPSIKHFSNDQFIDFQIGVLQLIKEINSPPSGSIEIISSQSFEGQ